MELLWPERKSTFEPILGTVMATLKSYVDGRHENVWVDCDEVAQRADVPFGFVYNLIESDFIEMHLQKKGAHWYDTPGSTIEIPSRFGLPLLLAGWYAGGCAH
jgi:hypothetical protein